MVSTREKKKAEKPIYSERKQGLERIDELLFSLHKKMSTHKRWNKSKRLFTMENVNKKYNNLETQADIDRAESELEAQWQVYKNKYVSGSGTVKKGHAKRGTMSPIGKPGPKCPVCRQKMVRDYRGFFLCEKCLITKVIPMVGGGNKISQTEMDKMMRLIKSTKGQTKIKLRDIITSSETDTKEVKIDGMNIRITKEINLNIHELNEDELEDQTGELSDDPEMSTEEKPEQEIGEGGNYEDIEDSK